MMSSQPPPNVAKLVEKLIQIPTPPAILSQVLNDLRNPTVTASKLGQKISADQGLASKILRIANSPFYGLSREVKNIQQAIVILGYKAVQGLVVSASSETLYKEFGPVEKALWEHSLGTAIAAHVVSNTFRMACREEAFVTGLMHDVGKVVMNNEAKDLFLQSIKDAKESHRETYEAEQEVFSFTHMDVGSLLVKQWKLSEGLEQSVFLHHDLDLASTVAQDNVELVYVTNLADLICHHLGIGTNQPPKKINFSFEPAVEELGLDSKKVESLFEKIQENLEQEKALFRG